MTEAKQNRPPLPYYPRQLVPWSKEPVPWGWWLRMAARSTRPAVIPVVSRAPAQPVPMTSPVTAPPASQPPEATAREAFKHEESSPHVQPSAPHSAPPRLGKLEARELFSGSYLVRRAYQGTRCDGRPFWKLLLGDESGWLQCFVWPEIQGADTTIVAGMYLFIEAHTRMFGDRLVADIDAFSVSD